MINQVYRQSFNGKPCFDAFFVNKLGVIEPYESAFDMFVRQVGVEGEGWMVLAIDNYDYGIF